jgi:hypothetical protein
MIAVRLDLMKRVTSVGRDGATPVRFVHRYPATS